MRKSAAWAGLVLSALLLAGPAWSQGEPTIDQIYQAASSGQMQQADRMIGEVLQRHPNSGKAHYVKAELAAREGDAAVARRELAEAERLAPGLPFAKPEAVQALRREVAVPSGGAATRGLGESARSVAPQPAPAPAASHFPWGLLALLVLVIVAATAFMRRRNPPDAMAGGMGGMGGPGGPYAGPGGYPPPGYGPGAYPPGYAPGYGPGAAQPQGGLGSSLGRGLATGLAVGAGVVAAEEIGHRMFDHRGNPIEGNPALGPMGGAEGNGMLDPSVNNDMGGQDFGIGDAGSWDDGGAGGGSSDWDS
ncbi:MULTISPECIES: tetratricopeptide repeat protein [Ramlibacter]|uniref:Tetratricopeptide repeat protein n=1 Tax=Ramlibacter aquaticus TaxID=2780094 RepID=A0ABR9SDS1_9BURK|nr:MULTISPECIES: tetratricopeptide repeat protein [Ramlibacter]MBE7940364.1 tetratricopeptide repeat protein [Ramlibacter aquaticus]